MEYQALYRKYRPQTFEEVIGQSHVTSTLAREVAEGRVAHAYLFAGPRGTGKTTTARILAKALNCTDRRADGSPCNRCRSCTEISEGASLDVLELDAASHNSVDDIREMRVSVSTVASSGGGRRVFILDEAHMLSKAAGNALLKTLEEPPSHVHFVLATTEPYKLLETIRSRSQRFDFHAVGVETLTAHLTQVSNAEGYQAEPAALVAVARHARGSVRDALSLLEQVAALGGGKVDVAGVARALGLADEEAFEILARAIAGEDTRTALELVARLAGQGVDLRRFAADAVGFFRGVFLAHYAPNLAEVADEPPEVIATWQRLAETLPASATLRAVDVLGDTLVRLREGREERLMLELALIRLTRPETATDPDALLARIDRLERRLADESRPAPRSEPKPAPRPTDSRPEVADRRPEPTGATVGFDEFRSIWPGLFGSLRELLGSRRWALFRETRPGAVEGSTLVIEVQHDFHLEALRSDPAVAAIVATRASDLLGKQVEVTFRAAAGGPEPEPTPEAASEPDPAPSDPFTLVERELGGRVVEEFPVDG
ncbi:MAG: DNA polymerase III subunit gamma/tau [Acidimicrobiia bacterium]|nr:MAG: DNA polymerase III subunit gamma/tau [Acidimicrobiia bacterium]